MSIHLLKSICMEFRDWLMDRFKEWERAQKNPHQSYSNFARYLGVSVNAYSQWRAGNNVPSVETAKVLSKKLGITVFRVLGYSIPADLDPLGARLESALDEARENIISSGFVPGSPEATREIAEALKKFDPQLISTRRDGDV